MENSPPPPEKIGKFSNNKQHKYTMDKLNKLQAFPRWLWGAVSSPDGQLLNPSTMLNQIAIP